jgi:YidC/Oxa1 family membrane protein insertase
MDVLRTILIGVVAVLSFMLLTEWVDFKAERTPQPPAQEAILLEDTQILPIVPDNPDAKDEIPVVSEPAAVAAPSVQTTDKLISMQTDVLTLIIDLNGGDIVQSALLQFPARLNDPGTPFLLLENGSRRSYVAQSGLVGENGIDKDGRAQLSASQTSFELQDNQDTLIVDLHYESTDGVIFTKRFTLRRGDYLVDIEYLIDNQSPQRWQGNLFGQIKRDSSDDPSSELSSGMGMVPFLGTAVTQPDERFSKFDFDEMKEKPFKQKLPGGWIAMIQHYFLSAWIPDPEQTHNYSRKH